MKVYCFSQKVLEKELGNKLPPMTSLISIANTKECCDLYEKRGDVLESYNPFPPSEHVMNLMFDDITEDHICWEGFNILGLQDTQAEDLVRFIDQEIKSGRDIYVHCLAGKSRSQGVVKYILDTYGRDLEIETNPQNPCITPNLHVSSKLMRAYEHIFCSGL